MPPEIPEVEDPFAGPYPREHGDGDDRATIRDATRELFRDAASLGEECGAYLRAQADLAKLAAKRAAISLGAGLLLLAAGAALVSAAAVFIVRGVATLLGTWLGREWLGDVLAGAMVLVVVAAAAWIACRGGLFGGPKLPEPEGRDATTPRLDQEDR